MSEALDKILAPVTMPTIPEDANEIDMYYLHVAARLRKMRVAMGWTQESVAHHVGVSRTQLVNIERGNLRCPLHVISNLSTLGVPDDVWLWVMTGDDDEQEF
ncbi:MAG: helix-turn-helix transcriptional regulator [Pseudomonadota bacterium]